MLPAHLRPSPGKQGAGALGAPYTVPGGLGQGDPAPKIVWRESDQEPLALGGRWPPPLWEREGLPRSFSVTGQLTTEPSPGLACWAPVMRSRSSAPQA